MPNKAKQVREALSLTPTKAGKLLFGYESKKAYDMWARWEKTGKWDASTENFFTVILTLHLCKEIKTKGATKALDIVLNQLVAERESDV